MTHDRDELALFDREGDIVQGAHLDLAGCRIPSRRFSAQSWLLALFFLVGMKGFLLVFASSDTPFDITATRSAADIPDTTSMFCSSVIPTMISFFTGFLAFPEEDPCVILVPSENTASTGRRSASSFAFSMMLTSAVMPSGTRRDPVGMMFTSYHGHVITVLIQIHEINGAVHLYVRIGVKGMITRWPFFTLPMSVSSTSP